jgi:hypothetical protein
LNPDSPSANAYKISSVIGKEGPHFIIGKKAFVKPSESSPGPIYRPNYNLVKKSAPSFTVRLKNVKLLKSL